MGWFFPLRQSIIQIKFCIFHATGCHISEKCMFKTMQRSFPIMCLWILNHWFVSSTIQHVPDFPVFFIYHFIKPIAMRINKLPRGKPSNAIWHLPPALQERGIRPNLTSFGISLYAPRGGECTHSHSTKNIITVVSYQIFILE